MVALLSRADYDTGFSLPWHTGHLLTCCNRPAVCTLPPEPITGQADAPSAPFAMEAPPGMSLSIGSCTFRRQHHFLARTLRVARTLRQRPSFLILRRKTLAPQYLQPPRQATLLPRRQLVQIF